MFGLNKDKKDELKEEEKGNDALGAQSGQEEDPLPVNPTENFEEIEDVIEEIQEDDPDSIPAGCIRLPEDIDLVKFVQDCYFLSSPQGLGHIHFTPGELPKSEAEQVVARFKKDSSAAVAMDYINGRAVKMTAWRNKAGSLYIRGEWFDHTKAEFYRLLQRSKVKGIKIDRDMEKEAEIQEQRNKNPFATQEGENE